MANIKVLENEITVLKIEDEDYICITDIAKYKDNILANDIIKNWLRNRNTIEFLGIWEQLNNPDFKPVEFDGFRKEAGLNSFTMSPTKWIQGTNAIGIVAKSGRYGGTYAHKDIAFEFASWVSVEFKLYLIKEFQRLKEQELKQLGWDIRRNLTKINYKIHTDAIKENLIPKELNSSQINFVYASEADILNVALFGMTAKLIFIFFSNFLFKRVNITFSFLFIIFWIVAKSISSSIFKELLTHAGKISHEMAISKSELEFKKFKDEQKKIEKIQSLKELEEDIKRLKW